MRRQVLFACALACAVLSGCAYVADRGRDLRDVFTLSGETGQANLGLHIGPIMTGFGYAEGKGFGLRSGLAGTYGYRDVNGLFAGERAFWPPGAAAEDSPERREIRYNWIPTDASNYYNVKPWRANAEIEVSLCLLLGLRLGVNLAEAADFLIGWTTLDICDDDHAPTPPRPTATAEGG